LSNHVEQLADKIRHKFNSGEVRLPVLPEAVLKVRAIIGDERKGSQEIAKVIGDNPTFSTAVLRIVNSARFNPAGKEIRNLPMAIQRLGDKHTLQLMISISGKMCMQVKNADLPHSLREISNHKLLVAVAAQHLAQIIPDVMPDEAFMAGLLYEIGASLVISAVPDDLIACAPDIRVDIVHRLHREMGARLFNYWNMPNVFTQVVLHHGIESDDRPREKLIDYVDAADFIVQHTGYRAMLDTLAEDKDPMQIPAVKRLGINQTHIAAIEVELEDELADLKEIFG